jgi:hypothetical protein
MEDEEAVEVPLPLLAAAPPPFFPPPLPPPFRIAARLFGFRTFSLRMSQKRSLAMCSCLQLINLGFCFRFEEEEWRRERGKKG